MKTAAIYARISEDRNGGGLGVERQEKDCRALAEQLGWTVTGVFADNDTSAYSGKKRPEYTQLVAAMNAGTITRVLAWHTDRIHRTPRELEDYIDASEAHGAVTHTVKAGLVDISNPGGLAMARTLCVWARYESDIKSARTTAWARQRAEKGKAPGGLRPFGWMPDRRTLDPYEHQVIKDLAKRIIAGESLRSLVADLNQRGVPTATWRPPLVLTKWSPTVVRSMMIRPRMAGWRVHNSEIMSVDGEAVRGEWQPALDDVTHQTICTVLTAEDRQSGGRGSRVNLLTGLALCGDCDERVTIQYGGPKRAATSRNSYGCSECGIWRAQEAVDSYVRAATIRMLTKMSTPDDPGVDPELLARITRLRARIVAADEAFTDDDTISPEQHRAIIRRLKARLEAEQKQLKPTRSHVLAGRIGPDAEHAWHTWTLDIQRAVIDAIFEIRILRAGAGKRVFRPETVQLVLR